MDTSFDGYLTCEEYFSDQDEMGQNNVKNNNINLGILVKRLSNKLEHFSLKQRMEKDHKLHLLETENTHLKEKMGKFDLQTKQLEEAIFRQIPR
jgi:hypothetical protein